MTSLLHVAQRGEAILSVVATPVTVDEFNSAWLYEFCQALYATMLARNGVGIAAPQVYVSKRIIIVASRPNPRYPNAPEMPAITMLNPEIIAASTVQCMGEEGCLSVPNTLGEVARAQRVTVRYYTLQGEMMVAEFTDFPARIVQHELDHLNGILFVDRLNNLSESSESI